MNPVQKFISKFSNPANVALATPIVVSSALPSSFSAAPAIIYGQSHGDIGRQISSEDSSRSSLVVH